MPLIQSSSWAKAVYRRIPNASLLRGIRLFRQCKSRSVLARVIEEGTGRAQEMIKAGYMSLSICPMQKSIKL